MLVSILSALIGCLLTGTQAVLIHLRGRGVCFNGGCEIVDSLTLVDPFYINVAGFFFFLLAALGLSRARRGSELWLSFTSLLLLAGLAAEGVLLAFQLLVSQVFCSYCLIILGLIVTANLFMGLKQMFKGLVIFAAVLAASLSLDYHGGANRPLSLELGTMSRYRPEGATTRLRLFVSSSCSHCQSVLAALEQRGGCAIDFNPVDRYDTFSFPGSETVPGYRPEVNLGFLKKLGIDEVPALLVEDEASMMVIRGEAAIRDFIDRRCGPPPPTIGLQSPARMSSASGYQLPLPGQEDGCSVEEECLEPPGQSPRNLP